MPWTKIIPRLLTGRFGRIDADTGATQSSFPRRVQHPELGCRAKMTVCAGPARRALYWSIRMPYDWSTEQ